FRVQSIIPIDFDEVTHDHIYYTLYSVIVKVCYAGGEWQDLLFRVQSIIPIDFDEVTHDQHSLLGFPPPGSPGS
ncbi:MAG TPA: hypothetical protein PKX41_08205, partial [Anaerolineaceae bacterium]|nr:hypothetical protein [Anaerolineaceae bacterium]HQP61180.1 hypothetical protein [Anaerolineaceae bacterium]